MADREPHGFSFDHVSRRPSGALSRQKRVASTSSVDERSSVRLSSLRSALFSGSKSRQQTSAGQKSHSSSRVNRTSSSGVFRSLFHRQVVCSLSIMAPSSADYYGRSSRTSVSLSRGALCKTAGRIDVLFLVLDAIFVPNLTFLGLLGPDKHFVFISSNSRPTSSDVLRPILLRPILPKMPLNAL